MTGLWFYGDEYSFVFDGNTLHLSYIHITYRLRIRPKRAIAVKVSNGSSPLVFSYIARKQGHAFNWFLILLFYFLKFFLSCESEGLLYIIKGTMFPPIPIVRQFWPQGLAHTHGTIYCAKRVKLTFFSLGSNGIHEGERYNNSCK